MIKTKLTFDDAQKVVQMGEVFMKEGRFKDHEYDANGVMNILANTIKFPDKFFCGLDDQYRGLILLGISKHYFSSYKWATDFAFFVVPEYRGGTLGNELLMEAEKWAKENGASEITILHNTGIKTETASRFFNAAGYETKGLIFTKDL